MIIFRTILLLTIATSLFASCEKHPAKELPRESHETAAQTETKKWPVNEEMKPFVAQGRQLVSQFLAEKGSDYPVLAKALQEQNEKLIQSCTMTGDAHDALHDWLHPQLKRVEALSKTADPKQAAQLVADMNQAYTDYEKIFE